MEEIISKESFIRTFETSDFSTDSIKKHLDEYYKEIEYYAKSAKNEDNKTISIQISKVELTKLDSVVTLNNNVYVPTLESYKEPTKKYRVVIEFDILRKID